ncbi:hypothetical protein M0805_009402 [Coniferiporia weirii]|nr:hypothetical protein M0805_009402 [Coniferiporia weirii]
MALYLAAGVSVLAAVFLLFLAFSVKSRAKLSPPGPPQNFIFGNALQLSKTRPWLLLAHWGHTYGDIMFMRVFRRPFIILNSYETATELLEKRSAIYSERPTRNMALMSGFGKALLFLNDGEAVRQTRKFMHSELNPRRILNHRPLQEDVARRMALRFLNGEHSLADNLRLTASTSLLKITYGYHIESVQDPLLNLAEDVMSSLADVITPNRYLVDALPILKHFPNWFPGCGFQKIAKERKATLEKFMELPFDGVRKQMKEGTVVSSFTSDLLENQSFTNKELDILKWTAGGIYAGHSVVTYRCLQTYSTLMSFFLAALLHPEVQIKAQEELDRVVGQDSLPSFKDKERLPYIEAILKEIVRWNPATPLVSRRVAVDDEYKGFHIPAKTAITVNVWALTHDETLYPNPMPFDPDRFLPKTGGEAPIPPDPRASAFGFGRRRCPGEYIADAFLYIVIATTLAVFRIVPEIDNDGKPIIPIVEYSTGAVSHPAPFKCRVEPRSPAAAKLIRDATEG